jgi:hypothetical protein
MDIFSVFVVFFFFAKKVLRFAKKFIVFRDLSFPIRDVKVPLQAFFQDRESV